jgi:hypothetical protein
VSVARRFSSGIKMRLSAGEPLRALRPDARVLKPGLDVLGIEIVEQMQPFRAFFSFSNANSPVFESKLFDFSLAFRFVWCYL